MTDLVLADHMKRIKREKPSKASEQNCIDFAFGESQYGVRVLVTYDKEQWLVSTSIGILTKDDYLPMNLSEWTPWLRMAATEAVDEVLEHFNIDQNTKRVDQGETIVLFRFRELAIPH